MFKFYAESFGIAEGTFSLTEIPVPMAHLPLVGITANVSCVGPVRIQIGSWNGTEWRPVHTRHLPAGTTECNFNLYRHNDPSVVIRIILANMWNQTNDVFIDGCAQG